MTDTNVSSGLDQLILSELPLAIKPTVEQFIVIDGTTLIINPSGLPTDPITDGRTAQAYAYAASRLVAGWYISLAPRKHIFHPATGPLTLNRGVYKDVQSGKWFFIDSMDGRYLPSTREVRPASRVQAHEFNDQLCTFRLEISLTRNDGEWYKWADVLIEVLNAPDRTEANRILNEHIKAAAERAQEWKATGKAVRDGNAVEIKSIDINGVDVMEFQAGTIWDKTVNKRFAWSAKDEYAVVRCAAAKQKGHELVFEAPASAF